MNFSGLLRKALPHLIAVVVFIALTVTFYAPIFFEGKVLNQNDINQGIASGSEIVAFREATGEEALWTNRMFGGMPAYLINIRWSGATILATIEKIISLGLPNSAKETFLSMLCFYVLMLAFGVRPVLAIAGAVAYAFSTYFIVSIEAGHLWKMRAIAYAPLVMAGIHLSYLRSYIWGFALSALALSLEINSNHIQIAYYLALLVVLYGIAQLVFAIRTKEITQFTLSTVLVIGAVILAVGANLGKLWTTYEYGKYSIRGASELTSNTQSTGGLDREYAFAWSSGKAESFTILVPNFYGGASGGYTGSNSELEQVLAQNNVPPVQIGQYARGLLGYWGPQPFTSGPVYAGAVVTFLFVIGILYSDPKYKWCLVAASVLSLALSWGKNFPTLNYFLFDYLPGYNKFRAVSMTVVIAMMTMPLLGMLGLEKLMSESWSKQTLKNLLIALGATAGLALLIAVVAWVPSMEGDQMPEWVKSAVDSSRKTILRKDAFRSIFFIVAAAASVYFYVRNKIGALTFGIIIIFLVAIDLLNVNFRYVNSENYISPRRNAFFTETGANKVILQDRSLNYRVLGLQGTFSEARTSAFHNSIGGYHGAKMRRYQDFFTHSLEPEINKLLSEGRVTQENSKLISMLNTKYLIAGQTEGDVVRNPYANGNAWFISELKAANSPDEEIEMTSQVDPRTTAVIDVSKFQPPSVSFDSAASVTLVEYAPNKLVYETTSAANGYVVFSEIYYPEGWNASIDGSEASIDRVNYILRGMAVPAGKHTIEFRFEPDSYYTGNKAMMVSNIVLLIILAASVFWSARKLTQGGHE